MLSDPNFLHLPLDLGLPSVMALFCVAGADEKSLVSITEYVNPVEVVQHSYVSS